MLRGSGTAYVTLIRNTPLTLIVFFCAFGLLQCFGLNLAPPDSPTSIVDNNFRWGVVALIVYHASFVAEAHPQRHQHRAEGPGRSGPGHRAGLRADADHDHPAAGLPRGDRSARQHADRADQEHHGGGHHRRRRGRLPDEGDDRVRRLRLIYLIFVIMAAGFVILTLPMGIFFTWFSRRLVVQR